MTASGFSIVIPTYNRLPYLRNAIASVQAQTVQDWELLVIDDGSADGSFEAVLGIAKDDARVRVFRNTGRNGPGGARNLGLRQARGRYVAFLDSDDLWEPDKLAHFVDAACRQPDAVLIGSDYRMVDRTADRITTMRDMLDGTMLPWWESYDRTKDLLPCQGLKTDRSLLARTDVVLSSTIAGFLWIHTSSAAIRRDTALAIGGFDETLRRTEDIDLWLRLNEKGPIVFIDQALATYDITGRDDASGARYAGQDGLRRHTAYDEWAHHLALMVRIRERHALSAAQAALMTDRLVYFHGNCANAAWQAGARAASLHHWWSARRLRSGQKRHADPAR